MPDQTNFDFVAIGDLATDAFIKLREAEVNCEINKVECKISMRFGDKIPYESVTVVPAVGNAPNAATAAARLGLRTALVSNLGADQNGLDALITLARNQIDARWVIKHESRLTNYHYVLWYADDRTILIKHENYDYVWPEIGEPRWLYLSSLGEHSLAFQEQITAWLAAHPGVKLAFQPGTWQIKLGFEPLAALYRQTEVFFCNVEEAMRILQIKTNDANGDKKELVKKLLAGLRKLGPKIAVITDGPEGAYASDGSNEFF